MRWLCWTANVWITLSISLLESQKGSFLNVLCCSRDLPTTRTLYVAHRQEFRSSNERCQCVLQCLALATSLELRACLLTINRRKIVGLHRRYSNNTGGPGRCSIIPSFFNLFSTHWSITFFWARGLDLSLYGWSSIGRTPSGWSGNLASVRVHFPNNSWAGNENTERYFVHTSSISLRAWSGVNIVSSLKEVRNAFTSSVRSASFWIESVVTELITFSGTAFLLVIYTMSVFASTIAPISDGLANWTTDDRLFASQLLLAVCQCDNNNIMPQFLLIWWEVVIYCDKAWLDYLEDVLFWYSFATGLQYDLMFCLNDHFRGMYTGIVVGRRRRRGQEALADCPRRGGAILIGSCVCTYVYIKSRKNTIGPKMKIFPLCLSVCLSVCVRTDPVLKSSTFVFTNRNTKRKFCPWLKENSRNTNGENKITYSKLDQYGENKIRGRGWENSRNTNGEKKIWGN